MTGDWVPVGSDSYEFRAKDQGNTVIGKVFKDRSGYRAEYLCPRDRIWKPCPEPFDLLQPAKLVVEGMTQSSDVDRR